MKIQEQSWRDMKIQEQSWQDMKIQEVICWFICCFCCCYLLHRSDFSVSRQDSVNQGVAGVIIEKREMYRTVEYYLEQLLLRFVNFQQNGYFTIQCVINTHLWREHMISFLSRLQQRPQPARRRLTKRARRSSQWRRRGHAPSSPSQPSCVCCQRSSSPTATAPSSSPSTPMSHHSQNLWERSEIGSCC